MAVNVEKQNIKVFVRIRPLSDNQPARNVLQICGSRGLMIKERSFEKNTKNFTFDKVFGPKTPQVDIYQTVVSPLVSEILAGYNCTVFAYGQTGTGKTFTMEGGKTNDPALVWHDDPLIGIIPRALSHLFDELCILQTEYSVKVSFLEVYNEELLDLLSPQEDSSKIKLYEDATKKGCVILHGLHEVTVRSKDEVYGILEKGSLKKQKAATILNAHSSRSHTIFTITVHIKINSLDDEELIKCGKLNLVDLAGSENIGRSGATEMRAREAGNINQSLLTLGRVMTSLVEKNTHIPYRESKLTRLLKDSLGGRTKTSIIATVSSNFINLEETLSTLEYAYRAQNIQNKPTINQRLAKKELIKEYRDEIDSLRRDLIASRERNGFYMAEENYNALMSQIETQKTTMTELSHSMKSLRDCLIEKEKSNAELSQSLADYNDKLEKTTHDLCKTKGRLKQTIRDRNEKEHIIEHHVTTEQRLIEQTQCVLAAADRSTADNECLINSLDRRRLLEKENKVACHNFQENTKRALGNLKLDIKKLEQSESIFTDTLIKRLGATSEDLKSWSRDAEQKVSSVIETQIQQHHFLDEEVYKLDPSVQLIGSSETAIDNAKEVHLKAMNEISGYHQRQFQCVKGQVTQLQNEKEALTKDIIALMELQKAIVEDFVTKTNKVMEELDLSVLQKVEDAKKISLRNNCIVKSVKTSKNSITEAAKNLLNSIQPYSAETRDNVKGLNRNRSERTKALEKLLQDLEKRKQCNISAVLSSTEDASSSMEGRLASFNEQTLNSLDKIEENASGLLHHVESMTSSESVAWQEHSQFQNDNLSNVEANIRAIHESYQEQSQNFIQELKSSSNIHADLRSDAVNVVERVKEECSADLDSHSQHMDTICHKAGSNIKQLTLQLHDFLEEDLKFYVSSGETPERQEIVYPRILKSTSPDQRILERYRARILEEESSLNSMIEEKENLDGMQENLSS